MRVLLLQNLPLKLVSLALASLLWFVIAGEKTSEMGLSVPLELKNFPKDLELTGDAVNSVEVRLRASPSIIQSLGPQEVSAHVDLTGVQEGEHIVNLTADSIRIPFGVKVVRIYPSTLTLNLERTVQKVVPVQPRLLGRTAPGYEVAEVTSVPPEVRVVGPKNRVQEVEGAFTEPVSVEGAETTLVEQVNLGVEDPLVRIQGSPRVRVTARIAPAQETRVITSVPVSVRNGTGTPHPPAVRVTLAGPSSVLKGVNRSDVHAYVELAGLNAGPLPVTVELASGNAGVSVKETDPPQVVVAPGHKKR